MSSSGPLGDIKTSTLDKNASDRDNRRKGLRGGLDARLVIDSRDDPHHRGPVPYLLDHDVLLELVPRLLPIELEYHIREVLNAALYPRLMHSLEHRHQSDALRV